MVQFCLTEAADASALKAAMREIAIDLPAAYVDTSRNTEEDFRSDAEIDKIMRRSYPIINVSVRADRGIGVSITNQGLPADQVVLGFFPASDQVAREAFARRVLSSLSRQWKLHQIKYGDGASALASCGGEPHNRSYRKEAWS